jgi:plastocyanin
MRDHSLTGDRRTRAMAAMLVTLVLILAACSSSGASEAPASLAAPSEAAASQPGASVAASQTAGGTSVTISGLAFAVAEITVPVGDLTFVNQDSVPHNLAEGENGTEVANPRVQKVSINPLAEGILTFTAAGDYHITCLIHPQMNMEVHVQ